MYSPFLPDLRAMHVFYSLAFSSGIHGFGASHCSATGYEHKSEQLS